MRGVHRFALSLLVATAAGCGSGAATDSNRDAGPAPSGVDAAVEVAPFTKESACETITSTHVLTKRPVDVIMVIDNSGSMSEEIEAVQNNVNVNFAQIIEQSGVDYRVILISRHGSASSGQSVCIRSPLSGTSCNPIPYAPVNGPRFFHYDVEIASTDSLSLILSTYAVTDVHGFASGGWKTWLRPDSMKVFIEITDDESDLSADDFEVQLFALTPSAFGSATQRGFVFHSIVGIVPNSPTTEPWGPTDLMKAQMCSTAASPGVTYEDLSLRTGGLRFPVCETSSYDAVFRAAAQEVIASSELRCAFTPAPPPQGQRYREAYVEYTHAGGAPTYLREVSDASLCNDTGFTRDAASNELRLCPTACDRVAADTSAQLVVLYACANPLN
jgi:hypothetical protein